MTDRAEHRCASLDDVTIRFRILRFAADGTSPGNAAAKRLGCICPARENRAGAGWDVSDDHTLKGFWIDEDCTIHGDELRRSGSS